MLYEPRLVHGFTILFSLHISCPALHRVPWWTAAQVLFLAILPEAQNIGRLHGIEFASLPMCTSVLLCGFLAVYNSKIALPNFLSRISSRDRVK